MTFITLFALASLFTSPISQAAEARQSATPATQSQSPADRERSGGDSLLDLPPLPESKATLIGGTVAKLDSVRDRMSIQVFGGGNMDVLFDVRTKVYRDGNLANLKDIRAGDRAYVDTILNGDHVFAKSIRISTNQHQGDARGQVVAFDARRGILTLHEKVSRNPLKFHVNQNTAVIIAQRRASVNELQQGALVEVSFAPGASKIDEVRQIRVVASPGATFMFAGIVTFVDLRLKRIAVANRSDKETYDIALGSLPSASVRDLREGVEATVSAVFDGKGYQAKSIDVSSPAAKEQ